MVKHIILQKIVAHDFRYVTRKYPLNCTEMNSYYCKDATWAKQSIAPLYPRPETTPFCWTCSLLFTNSSGQHTKLCANPAAAPAMKWEDRASCRGRLRWKFPYTPNTMALTNATPAMGEDIPLYSPATCTMTSRQTHHGFMSSDKKQENSFARLTQLFDKQIPFVYNKQLRVSAFISNHFHIINSLRCKLNYKLYQYQ